MTRMSLRRHFTLGQALILACSLASACARPPTIVTPQGKAAYDVNEVLKRVEALEDAAMAAHRQGELDTTTARAIVFATVQLAEIADAATQGWEASLRQAWEQAKQEVAALREGGEFAALAAAIDEMLKGDTP